jgi:hypothetical protein
LKENLKRHGFSLCLWFFVVYIPNSSLFMYLGAGIRSPVYEFNVPHALALAEDKEMLCVADRENGRVQCFNCHNGSFIVQFRSQEMGSRIFGVAYSPAQGTQEFD